ncbi:MAG: 1-acyl-sn-glycerol-3-phosphate acyltransferase [Vicingaceae bacterium]|jgi:1-acyl-sn-glycerol-3-phosphate acyltransferase
MLYRLLQFLMRSSLAAHYLEIKGIGMKRIPKDGACMIAATHPNSFLDAIIIACLIDRPLHFLARSDVFSAKWADKILRNLNLIPIYRLQEGPKSLSRNDDTFRECHSILEQGGAILIFIEGLSLIDFKIRPLKKGLARIAFGFAKKNDFKLNCAIVPLSLNYDRPKDFRSKVNVGVGQVQYILDYQENFEMNENGAFEILNKVLHKELAEHTVQVEDENYMVYKALAELDSCFEQNSLNRKILIADHISKVAQDNNECLKELSSVVHNAFDILKKNKLNFRKLKSNVGVSAKDVVLLIISAPFAILAFVINFLPFVLAKSITKKKVKLDEFYASVRLALGTILWIIWSIIFTVVFLQFTPWAFILPIAMYWCVRFYLRYYEKAHYVAAAYRLTRLKKEIGKFQELQQLLKQIYKIRRTEGLAPNT